MKNNRQKRRILYGFIAALFFVFAAPCAAAQEDTDTEYMPVQTPTYAPQAADLNSAAYAYDPAFSSQLTAAARDIYDALLAHTETIADGKSRVEISFGQGITKETFRFSDYVDAVSAFTRDHSEVFWIDFSNMTLSVYEDAQTGGLRATLDAPSGSYYITPYTDPAQVQRDRQALDDGLTRALEMIDPAADHYTQLLQMHDWLCANNTYNDNLAGNDMRMFEAVSALDADPDTKPVCEGYARALKLLCDARGIPCVLVGGAAVRNGYAVAHMWNLVYLDGSWYAVDVTWDDTAIGDGLPCYDYFLTGASNYANTAKFSDSHVPNGVINSGGSLFFYPELSETAYVYAPASEEGRKESLLPGFEKTGVYTDALFTDVSEEDWYRENVAQAYALGLMVGNGDGTFRVNGDISAAECISIAARIHAAYYGGEIPVSGGVWYEGAVRYALENGILQEAWEDYTLPVNRLTFAQILSRALPADALEAINPIQDGAIPDVEENGEVYLLYRAGILRGEEDGRFHPDAAIRRCEVAAIVTRMADTSLRVAFTL